jgi:hypothetical protein
MESSICRTACRPDRQIHDTVARSTAGEEESGGYEGMRRTLLPVAALCCLPVAVHAGPMEEAMKKLAPEERAHQACALRGVDTLRRDKRLPGADRIKTGITSAAAFDGSVVKANGGAVRAKGKWYSLKFTCAVTADRMKAVSFTYELGQEIPEAKWDAYGLWR